MCYNKDQLKGYKLHFHYILNVLLRYAKDNATLRLTHLPALQQCLFWCENILTVFNLWNFFRFLKTGQKASLTDVVLGLDNISMYGNKRREIGYSYMTRELIWGGFMELLGFTLPLINYHYVKRKLRNAVTFRGKSEVAASSVGKPVITSSTKCEFCLDRPTLPHHMGCQHVFCYYCLKVSVCVAFHWARWWFNRLF